ncbi:coil containing protein [Vibrio phage 1.101.O._10N.261.45.C6]|nr:coil containing protein [Vibrio phage 1.101.O._10N.261.45.C6]
MCKCSPFVKGAFCDQCYRNPIKEKYKSNIHTRSIPTHEVDFPVGKINQPLDKCFHIGDLNKWKLIDLMLEEPFLSVHKFQMDIIEQEEKLLQEYFLEVHNLDIEHLTKVCNNFKLKDCFEKHSHPRRDEYLYKGEVFLVKETTTFWGGKPDETVFRKVGGW